ncbi:MAG: glycerophosphodiester phosphodiesterase [Candidatus Brockarchaeota archaeon]|nr:glycerophosphodiester phosphodiesterase [Candidatus Brockarchaeota archaeon]
MRTVVVGHRGAPNLAPENTIPSFLKAVEVGVDAIELDARETKDGALVVIHDESVDRTTNGSGLVRELLLEEVKKLDAGSWFDPSFRGVRVPTLEEALESIDRKVMARIELKDGGIEEKACSIIKKLGVANRAQVASFELERVKKAKEACPSVSTVSISTKFTEGFLLKSIESCVNTLAVLVGKFSEADVHEAHVRGLTFDAWPVDDANLAKMLVEQGVDSITSNVASEIKKVL